MARPTVEIDGCREAQRVLLARVLTLDDAVLRRPSLLPGWTVGHVLGHLTSNADSVVRRLRGVIEGRVLDQYVGGAGGRAAEIEQLARLPYAEMLAGLQRSSAEVDGILGEVPDDGWDRLSRSVSGSLVPAHQVVFSRWREVEVHHGDLGLGHTPADWPEALVTRWMPGALAGLADRADPTALVAWVAGRGPAPELAPWD